MDDGDDDGDDGKIIGKRSKEARYIKWGKELKVIVFKKMRNGKW